MHGGMLVKSLIGFPSGSRTNFLVVGSLRWVFVFILKKSGEWSRRPRTGGKKVLDQFASHGRGVVMLPGLRGSMNGVEAMMKTSGTDYENKWCR